MKEIKVLSPTAILGYGFPKQSFERGLEMGPDVIAVDAGSTDPGPYYLGAGVSFTDRKAVYRDLSLLIKAGVKYHIPVIIGSAGGSGARPHVKWTLDILKEISDREKVSFKTAVIYGDIEKSVVLDAIKADRVISMVPELKAEISDVSRSSYIVGQMGVEPFIRALEAEVDVIVAGRAYDPAVFAALPIMRGFDPGLALHMGKVLECAAIAAVPGSGSDCMMGILREDYFLLEPLNPIRRCTTTSVAAHTLYEKSNPYLLPGPGGLIDLTDASFEQYNEKTVKISGSRWVPAGDYSIKLEGAKSAGFRTISVAGARDPLFIAQVDEIIARVKGHTADNFPDIRPDQYTLLFHVYGKNGVMGDLEPQKEVTSHELGIVIEAVAETQETANTICSFARSTILHYGYPGRRSTAGNLAFLYSPSDLKAGEVFIFSVYQLIRVDDPCALFPMEIIKFEGGQAFG